MRLGRLIPVLIATSFTLDIGLRFLPVEWFTFRAWEAVCRYPRSVGPCTPNARYENHFAHGDLPNLTNRPELAVFHTEIFTTDANGCRRNGNEPVVQPIHTLLIGDSFAMGSGVSDEETLSAQLEKIWRRPVYNAGNMKLTMWRVNALLDRLKMTDGVVLYECMERSDFLRPDQAVDAHYTAWEQLHRGLEQCKDGFWQVSPLHILCQRAYKWMQTDRLLPNTKRNQVIERPLKNGVTALFLPADMDNYDRVRPMDIGGVPALRDNLKRRGLKLVVVLVPDKYDTYAPLFQNPPPAPAHPYLDQLEEALEKEQLPVINLRQIMREEAARDLSKGEYLYLQDDTHWNSHGIAVAAREIARRSAFASSAN